MVTRTLAAFRGPGARAIEYLPHHGVPGLVYKDHYYFGQDKFNEFKQALINDNLLKA